MPQIIGPTTKSLRSAVLAGSAWTTVGYGAQQALRLGFNLILTRLLFPEAFGLMLLVNTFVRGLNMFSDLGIGPCIIRDRRGERPEFLNTAWTIQILRGVMLWGVVCAASGALAAFYGQPTLRWLFVATGATAGFAGLQSVAIFLAQKRMDVRRLVKFELYSQVISLLVTLLFAVILRSVWALVIGVVVRALARVALSHLMLSNHKHGLRWEPSSVRRLLSFGKWIFVSTALTFVASQADRLIMGRLVPFDTLGIYGIAVMLVGVVRDLVAQLESKVVLPAVSLHRSLPNEVLRTKMDQARLRVLRYCAPCIAILVCFADVIVRALYDDRYHAAGWMASILAVSAWISVLGAAYGPTLLAVGQPRVVALANGCHGLVLVVSLPLAYHWFGIAGAITAVTVAELPRQVVLTIGVYREGLATVSRDVLATGQFAIWLGVLFAARSLV